MADFKYKAVTNSGERVEGVREAATSNEVLEYLQDQDLIPISIEESLGFNFGRALNSDIGGLKLTDKVVMVKQLSTMIAAGIPIIQAIDILVQQSDKEATKEKFQNIYKLIESGSSLSESFSKEGGIFSEVQVNLLAAGEKSGNLSEMLIKIAGDMEKSKNLRGKIQGAMIYPVIIFVVMLAVLVIMIVFMVPQVKELYNSLGQTELPFVTEVLITIGNAVTNIPTVIVLIFVLITLYVLFRYYYSTPNGKLAIDKFKLRIPIFGNLLRKIELVEFCRIFAMLLESGIPIIEALDIVAKAMGNEVFKDILMNTKEELTKGSSLALGIAKFNNDKAFPIILIKMIATGEESGKADVVLKDMGLFYENEVEQITGNLTKLMEPFILVLVGGMVGFMAIAIYLPIYQVGEYVNK